MKVLKPRLDLPVMAQVMVTENVYIAASVVSGSIGTICGYRCMTASTSRLLRRSLS